MQELHAWVDESDRLSSATDSVYSMCASLVPSEREQSTRLLLRGLALPGTKLHWHDLGAKGRQEAAQRVSTLNVEHLIVTGVAHGPVRSERARGQCVERLLWELSGLGASRVIFESRSTAQDRRDLQRIDGLRSRGIIPAAVRTEWRAGSAEPLLWLPDVALGAQRDPSLVLQQAAIRCTTIAMEL